MSNPAEAQRPARSTIIALCKELGAHATDHVHEQDGVTVIFTPELHRYLVIDPNGKEWWTNDLVQVWPELLTTDQLEQYKARFRKHVGIGPCAAWCKGNVIRTRSTGASAQVAGSDGADEDTMDE